MRPIQIPTAPTTLLKGIVTLQAHRPNGELIHEEVKENLITNMGLAGIDGVELGDEMLSTCILGRDGTAAQESDGFFAGSFIDSLANFVCPQDLAGDSYCPVPQDRSIVARSTDNGGTADVYAQNAGEKYWSLTRKRVFEYHTDYFLAAASGVSATSCMEGRQFADWVADGWTQLPTEASYIKEIGFTSGTIAIQKPTQACPPVDPDPIFKPHWANHPDYSGVLWNRVVMDQSVGYPSASPWATPDVELALDAIITVTMELRAYYSTDTITQVMDINGISTTVRTRVLNINFSGIWAEGFLRKMGNWGKTGKNRIGESNVLPAPTSYYFADGGSAKLNSGKISSVGGVMTRRLTASTSQGNWVGGIGGLCHGQFTNNSEYECYCTVFNPKVVKTSFDEAYFDVQYTWGPKI